MTNTTDNRTTDLLPCPFCGGEAEAVHEIDGFWTVECVKCGALVDGIEAWNTRAERTCRNLDKSHNIMFKCSECGHWECQDFDGEKILPQTWNYCPNCGAKVVGE